MDQKGQQATKALMERLQGLNQRNLTPPTTCDNKYNLQKNGNMLGLLNECFERF